jgi:hypothetical protein
MKSINHAITGLASSLLLNVGLTSAAEKFDTIARGKSEGLVTVQNAASAQFCELPSQFSVDTGL